MVEQLVLEFRRKKTQNQQKTGVKNTTRFHIWASSKNKQKWMMV